MELHIEWCGGNCPVQAEGTIDGEPFYFRARGQRWMLVLDDESWRYDEPYGGEPYDAGWMAEADARKFIAKAAEKYADFIGQFDDGQPTEAQEWSDYDADC